MKLRPRSSCKQSRVQDRFPDDFMFQLTKEEFGVLRSQTVTSSPLVDHFFINNFKGVVD